MCYFCRCKDCGNGNPECLDWLLLDKTPDIIRDGDNFAAYSRAAAENFDRLFQQVDFSVSQWFVAMQFGGELVQLVGCH